MDSPIRSLLPNPSQMDSTRLKSWMTCRRRFYYSHIRCLVPLDTDGTNHVVFGQMLHEALESWEHLIATGMPSDMALETILEATYRATIPWQDDPAFQSPSPKTQRSLLRFLIWYAEQFPPDSDPIRPMMLDGKPATEVRFEFPLDLLAQVHGLETPRLGEWPEPPSIVGRLDGLVTGPSDGDGWVRDRKSTQSGLSSYYFSQFSPSLQFSIYAMVARSLPIEILLRGVLLEAIQIGASFVRVRRLEMEYHKEQSKDTLRTILGAFRDMADAGVPTGNTNPDDYPLNETACMSGGSPCPFRALCNEHPALREETIARQFQVSKNPWNPMEPASRGQRILRPEAIDTRITSR